MAKRIVAVDDDIDFLELEKTWLEEAGYEVKTCSDANQAIPLLKEWKPDLLLLDIWMPNRSGWEVLELLQIDPEVRRIPVIFVTAATMEVKSVEKGIMDRYRQRLRADTLFKPFDMDALLAKVDNTLNKPS